MIPADSGIGFAAALDEELPARGPTAFGGLHPAIAVRPDRYRGTVGFTRVHYLRRIPRRAASWRCIDGSGEAGTAVSVR